MQYYNFIKELCKVRFSPELCQRKRIIDTFQDKEAVCLNSMRFVCVNRNRGYGYEKTFLHICRSWNVAFGGDNIVGLRARKGEQDGIGK